VVTLVVLVVLVRESKTKAKAARFGETEPAATKAKA